MTHFDTGFGVILKKYRLLWKLTTKQLADISGIDWKSLSRYENGHNQPQFRHVIILVNVLDIHPLQVIPVLGPEFREPMKELLARRRRDSQLKGKEG